MIKLAKLAAIAIVLIAAASFTAPIWGGCGFNESLCSGWCEVRHFNSNVKAAACRAGCAGEKLICLTK